MDRDRENLRNHLLSQFGETLAANVTNPSVVSNPVRLQASPTGNSIDAIAGPRVGAIEILAGVDTGKLYRMLTADNMALSRQFVPWDFEHNPTCYLNGRRVRLEVAWPKDLQQSDIPLESLGRCPERGDLFIVGMNERGATIRLRMSDQNPHLLIGGATGSGKTWTMRSIAAQLSRQDQHIVLCDGKWGRGLAPVDRLPGQVGPLATEGDQIRAALGWVYNEMKSRYTHSVDNPKPITVIFDEFQELTRGNADPVVTELLRRIGALGRDANVHLVCGTQHATVDVFGDSTTRRHFTLRIALKVTDYSASEAVVGGPTPRADQNLLGSGDAYVVTPNVVQRVQMAYIAQARLSDYTGGMMTMDSWPAFSAEDLGTETPTPGRPQEQFSEDLIVEAILAAAAGQGRDKLIERIRDRTGAGIGSGRASRLLTIGRNIQLGLEVAGYCDTACPPETVDMGQTVYA